MFSSNLVMNILLNEKNHGYPAHADIPTPVSLPDTVLELHYIQSNLPHCIYGLLLGPQLRQTVAILQYNVMYYTILLCTAFANNHAVR